MAVSKWGEATWAQARQAYVDDDTASYQDISDLTGISHRALRDRASKEKWKALREERKAAELEAEKRIREQTASLNAEAIVEARSMYKRVARRVLQRCLDNLRGDRRMGADELAKLAAVVSRCHDVEWAAYGIPKATEQDGSAAPSARVVIVPSADPNEKGDGGDPVDADEPEDVEP